MIYAIYRKGSMNNQMHQIWLAKFHAGDFSPINILNLGKPVEVDSNQIKTLNENKQHYMTQENVANVMKISKSNADYYL